MKIIFAPDSFKGTFHSFEIIRLLDEAARRIFGDVETIGIPIADGGEGTIDALLAAVGGTREQIIAMGPMGNSTNAAIGYIHGGKTAVVEMAEASGLELVQPGLLNPLAATSYGTGEMIRWVLNKGIRNILIGIGGSATNDGGMGAMNALGIKFLDQSGEELLGSGADLERVKSIDMKGLNPAVYESNITIMSDVTNPLLGDEGATYMYGSQKGATSPVLDRLERGMCNYVKVMEKTLGKNVSTLPGSGAAGGMGAALMIFLNAELKSGVDVILDEVDFDTLLNDTSLVVTGEGHIDEQSVHFGKVLTGIMKRCSFKEVPVAIISGGMEKDLELLWSNNTGSIMTTINKVMTIEEAIYDSEILLKSAIERMFLFIKIGMSITTKLQE